MQQSHLNNKVDIDSVTGEVEIGAKSGSVEGKSVSVKGNGVGIYANNITLGVETIGLPNSDHFSSSVNNIISKGDVNFLTNYGAVKIDTANINAVGGNVNVSGNSVILEKGLKQNEKTSELQKDSSDYIISGDNIYIIADEKLSMFGNDLKSEGNTKIEGGELFISFLKSNSSKNFVTNANKKLDLYFSEINSSQNIALSSKNDLYVSDFDFDKLSAEFDSPNGLNQESLKKILVLYYPNSKDLPNKLVSKGVTSLVSGKDIKTGSLIIDSGAILIEANGNFINNMGLDLNTKNYNYLNKSANFNDIDGNISIYAKDNILFEEGNNISAYKGIKINSGGEIKSSLEFNGALYKGEFERLNIIANDGVSISGSGIDLKGVSIQNNSSLKPVNISSYNKDVKINVTRFEKENIKHDFEEIIKKLKLDVKNVDNLISSTKKILPQSEKDQIKKALNDLILKEPNFIEKFDEYIKDLEKKDKAKSEILGSNFRFALAATEGDISDFTSSAIDVKKLTQNKNDLQALITYLDKNPTGHFYDSNLIFSKSDINILSGKGASLVGTNIVSDKVVNISSSGSLDQKYTVKKLDDPKNVTKSTLKDQSVSASLVISGIRDFYDIGDQNGKEYSFRTIYKAPNIIGKNGVNINAVDPKKSEAIIHAATIGSSDGNLNIHSMGDLHFEADGNESYERTSNTYRKTSMGGLKKKVVTENSVNSSTDLSETALIGKNIKITSAGSINFHSTDIQTKDQTNISSITQSYLDRIKTADGFMKFLYDDTVIVNQLFLDQKKPNLPDGKINIATTQGLHFFAVSESNESKIDVTKTSSFAGIKLDNSKTSDSRTQVTELPSILKASYVNTDSGWNTLLQGTVFDTLHAANIRAGVGDDALPNAKIILEGIKDTVTKSHTEEKNSVVWQKMAGKGSTEQTLELPKFNGLEKPVFNAPGGLNVQVPVGEKDQNKVQLRDQILKLANQPGNQYLKDLVNRKDVDWQKIILTQKDWDYKSQGLTGAGAALLVIIVTVLTSGAGTAAASAAGGGAVGAGAQAAVATLASQASVSLINNGGDIGKTLKDLGSKESVKGLLTSVITAGLLNEVGTILNIKPDSDIFTNRVISNFTNSIGSSLVQTAVNGGSLRENLEAALLAGLSGVVQGELALQIKPLADIDYVLHKISHAAAGCLAGAIQNQCEAGALGASVGEIVASYLNDGTRILTDAEKEQIINKSKLVAGTIAAFSGYDVNSAASAADIAVRNNNTHEAQMMEELDALWIDSGYNKDKYYQGVDKIVERDGLALSILTSWMTLGVGGSYFSEFISPSWKNLPKYKQNYVNDYMTQFGKGEDGAVKLLEYLEKNGVPNKIDKKAFSAYQNQILKIGGNKAKTSNSKVFTTRVEILKKLLGGK